MSEKGDRKTPTSQFIPMTGMAWRNSFPKRIEQVLPCLRLDIDNASSKEGRTEFSQAGVISNVWPLWTKLIKHSLGRAPANTPHLASSVVEAGS